jgi:RHS repeat-associated protein
VTGGASFSYEPLGRRIFTTLGGTTKSYTYFGGNPLMEQEGNTVTAEILAGLGLDERYQRTTTTGSSAGAYSMLTDALGSTVALTNSSGAITTTYAYDPYGNTTASGTASDSSYQFTGRENDGTGLYEYRQRYYAPSWGRFVSEDPIGFGGGDADLYRYVGGNPTMYRDPTGLLAQVCLGGGTTAAFYIGGSVSLAGCVNVPDNPMDWRCYQFSVQGQGNIMGGLGGFFGTGVQGGVTQTSGLQQSGFSGSINPYAEVDVGAGPSIGVGVNFNRQF